MLALSQSTKDLEHSEERSSDVRTGKDKHRKNVGTSGLAHE
jgi:hypothetical protein